MDSSPAGPNGSAATQDSIQQQKQKPTLPQSQRTGANGHEDDEEEEGMLHVTEEGQIEEEANQKQQQHISDSQPSRTRLASRPVSPRPAPYPDRDRYYEEGPSRPYASSRQSYAYQAESASPYAAHSSYGYLTPLRDPGRSDSYAPSARASFSGSIAPRTEAPASRRRYLSPGRSSDTYRPASIRERDWDREREREWSVDRDREAYRYRDIERERDWDRERNRTASLVAGPYDPLSDPAGHPGYASANYAAERGDYGVVRPLSPTGRDYEREWERERVHSRDQRAWGASTHGNPAWRHWGSRSSDDGRDNRDIRDVRDRRPTDDEQSVSELHRRVPTKHRSSLTPRGDEDAAPASTSVRSASYSDKGDNKSWELSPRDPKTAPQRYSPGRRRIGSQPRSSGLPQHSDKTSTGSGPVSLSPVVKEEKKPASFPAHTSDEQEGGRVGNSVSNETTKPAAQPEATSPDAGAKPAADSPSDTTALQPSPKRTEAAVAQDAPAEKSAANGLKAVPEEEKTLAPVEASEKDLDAQADAAVAPVEGTAVVAEISTEVPLKPTDKMTGEEGVAQVEADVPAKTTEGAETAPIDRAPADKPTSESKADGTSQPKGSAKQEELIASTETTSGFAGGNAEPAMDQALEPATGAEEDVQSESKLDASAKPNLSQTTDAQSAVEMTPAAQATEDTTMTSSVALPATSTMAEVTDLSTMEKYVRDEQKQREAGQKAAAVSTIEAAQAAPEEPMSIVQKVATADVPPAEVHQGNAPVATAEPLPSGGIDAPQIPVEPPQVAEAPAVNERDAIPEASTNDDTPAMPSIKKELSADVEMQAPAPDDPALDREAEAAEEELIEQAQQQSKQHPPALHLHGLDDGPLDTAEIPLYTPRTEAERQKVFQAATRKIILERRLREQDCKDIVRENRKLADSTTLDQLHARIHGIPLIVSDSKPLWRDEDDKDFARTRAILTDRLLSKRKRLNDKLNSLKQQYRTINEEWQVHCARLDRIAERREIQRRPLVSTLQGTPVGTMSEDVGNPPGSGGSILASALLPGRANRRNNQAGFAGFGDAVRSEAEFLEILASLENADMQDPNMRAARTTATAPDMEINPDDDEPLLLEFDDSNGFVADPIAFYLSDFDPDVWSEEEKAIFARRYALWPKQFGKIAQALPNKTPSQCVVYYYLSKKTPGNDFKALAASRNRERKRKARVKPKKAKGSALMADLKSAKGDDVDDDDNGAPSPIDTTDTNGGKLELSAPPSAVSRRGGGRSRLISSQTDGNLGTGGEDGMTSSSGKKRAAEDDSMAGPDAEQEQRPSEKKRSGPKARRVKTEGGSADKAKRGKGGSRRASGEGAAAAKNTVSETDQPLQHLESMEKVPVQAASLQHPQQEHLLPHAESDLAAAEALGALAGMFGPPGGFAGPVVAHPDAVALGVNGEIGKAPKKRRGKGQIAARTVEGQDGEAAGGKSKTRQPTSSYWSVAERSEFLRSLALHGKNWDAISSTLSQKSAAQARNYFARNAAETDFAEAAALAEQNASLPLEEREKAASAFARQKFTSAATAGSPRGPPPMGGMMASAVSASTPEATRLGGYFPMIAGTPHAASATPTSVSVGPSAVPRIHHEDPNRSPPAMGYRGLQINSLLNEERASDVLTKRRSSVHDWFGDRREGIPPYGARDAHRGAYKVDDRPRTAGRLDEIRGSSAEGRPFSTMDNASPSKRYEAFGVQRQPSSAQSYSTMPPPSAFQRERSPPAYGSRYAGPAGPGQHRPPPPSLPSPSTLETRGTPGPRYGAPDYRGPGTPSIHLPNPHSPLESEAPLPSANLRRSPVYEGASSATPSYPSMPPYQRYSASPGPSAIYSREPPSRAGRPLASPYSQGPTTARSERSPPDHRWHRVSDSPGPSATSPGYGSLPPGPYSAGSAYRSSSNPYSSYGSQGYPRPSGNRPPPILPPLSAAGRRLPPILGSYSSSGPRSLPPSSRPPHPDEHRWHQQQQHER